MRSARSAQRDRWDHELRSERSVARRRAVYMPPGDLTALGLSCVAACENGAAASVARLRYHVRGFGRQGRAVLLTPKAGHAQRRRLRRPARLPALPRSRETQRLTPPTLHRQLRLTRITD
jgi:hypothetical protein